MAKDSVPSPRTREEIYQVAILGALERIECLLLTMQQANAKPDAPQEAKPPARKRKKG